MGSTRTMISPPSEREPGVVPDGRSGTVSCRSCVVKALAGRLMVRQAPESRMTLVPGGARVPALSLLGGTRDPVLLGQAQVGMRGIDRAFSDWGGLVVAGVDLGVEVELVRWRTGQVVFLGWVPMDSVSLCRISVGVCTGLMM